MRPIHLARSVLVLVALGVASAPSTAAAQELRYSTTTPGGIVATGNTLGLAKALNDNGPGTLGSIGTFIAADPTDLDDVPAAIGAAWPAGTTSDWMDNGSAAVLDLPAGADVLYAELVWGGSYQYGGEDVSAHLDDAVTLAFGTSTLDITPDAETSQKIQETGFSGFLVRYYIRSADVTSFIQSHGEGTYSVSGVPATQNHTVNTLNSAGWTLVVAYRSNNEPIRNLSVFVGGSFVDEDATQDYAVSGFCAPPFGPVEGKVVVSALEGDADLSGDAFSIAPTVSDTFVFLEGPNNPDTNFFAGQINRRDGQRDTSGTFGTSNHDAFGAINTSGGRQGWDITAVPVSSADGMLDNDQTSAVLRADTDGDSFLPTVLAFEIDVKSPDFTSSQTRAEPSVAAVDDRITVTATLTNSGEAPAADLQFVLAVDPGLSLVAYTTDGAGGDANGATVTAARLASGVPAGLLDVDESRTIVLTFDVIDAPADDTAFVFAPVWDHDFVVCEGDPAIEESHGSPPVTVTWRAPEEPGDDTGLDTGNGDDEPHCGCATTGPATSWWAGLALLGLVARRRR